MYIYIYIHACIFKSGKVYDLLLFFFKLLILLSLPHMRSTWKVFNIYLTRVVFCCCGWVVLYVN